MRPRRFTPDTQRVTTSDLVSRGPRIAAGAIAFVVPWLLVAMGSPLYTEHAGRTTLGLWLAMLVASGLSTLGGSESSRRRIGRAALSGTLLGGCLFVLTFGLVVLIAPV
jgi:hypothetical protein